MSGGICPNCKMLVLQIKPSGQGVISEVRNTKKRTYSIRFCDLHGSASELRATIRRLNAVIDFAEKSLRERSRG